MRHTAHASLNWRAPYEAIHGETGDISHLRLPLWSPIWFKSEASKMPERTMIKGMYLGPAESTGDTHTYNILPLDKIERNEKRDDNVIIRSYVVMRDPEEKTFRQELKNHRRGFLFPRYLFPSRYDRDGTPWNVDKAITRGKDGAIEKVDKLLVERAHARKRPVTPMDSIPETKESRSKGGELHQMAETFRRELLAVENRQDPDAAHQWTIIGHVKRKSVLHLTCFNLTNG